MTAAKSVAKRKHRTKVAEATMFHRLLMMRTLGPDHVVGDILAQVDKEDIPELGVESSEALLSWARREADERILRWEAETPRADKVLLVPTTYTASSLYPLLVQSERTR